MALCSVLRGARGETGSQGPRQTNDRMVDDVDGSLFTCACLPPFSASWALQITYIIPHPQLFNNNLFPFTIINHHAHQDFTLQSINQTITTSTKQIQPHQPKWIPSRTAPTTLLTRFSPPPAVLPRRPTRRSPRTTMSVLALGKLSL